MVRGGVSPWLATIFDYFFLFPMLLIVGISSYFGLQSEPSVLIAPAGLVIAVVVFYFLRSKILVALAVMLLGFGAAQWHSIVVDTHMLSKPIYLKGAEAWVKLINNREGYTQLVLEGMTKGLGKVKIAVRTKIDSRVELGDKVRLSAKLIPPTNALTVDGYDFARSAYFSGISAFGYATSKVELLVKRSTVQKPLTTEVADLVNFMRQKIDDFFAKKLNSPECKIASALIVGKKDIPKKALENIRNSGLSHLLAISGLHLSLIASCVFVSTRWLLSRSSFLTLKYDIKKIAAFVSVILVTIYLVLSGASISAQRSYIMVLLFLLAILLDKQNSAMHAVSVAAIFILLAEPESVIHPSFQMSFAAVLSLLRFGMCGRNYILSLLQSSLLATLATLPFTIYNFNYFALGGLAANLLAVPLTTFVIIPFSFLSVILWSDLSDPFIWVVSYSIKGLLWMAEYFASWRSLIIYAPSFSPISLLLMSFGLVWLCMSPKQWHLLGIPMCIIGLLVATITDVPDVFIESNNVAVRGVDSKLYFLNGKQRRNFISKSWLLSNVQAELLTYRDHPNTQEVSLGSEDGVHFVYRNHSRVVNLYVKKGSVAVNCGSEFIGPKIINAQGPLFIWVSEQKCEFLLSQRNRIWNHGNTIH